MTKYLLRVDAVNLSQFVFDTHDISTIRGGSFILLEAIEKIENSFSGRLKAISTAASQGLFAFDCPDGEDDDYLKRIRNDIQLHLHEATGGHATFVIAIEKNEGEFPLILEKLEAQVHRQQWRLPTVAVPDFESTDQECYLDGWRPGTVIYRADPALKKTRISASTQFRRERGRELRHKLFYELLVDEQYSDILCTKDLSKLAQDRSQGVLDGKIAYIYVDGNSFNRIRRKLCKTEDLRRNFDKRIQDEFRKPFLKDLLRHADLDQSFQTEDVSGQKALRLEVLMWGGDEMTIIVPAWKGLEVAQLFFDYASKLSFDDLPLSHRAAIIFCHQNMPILQMRQVAENLLYRTRKDIQVDLNLSLKLDSTYSDDQIKETELLLSDHRADACHYLALESIDMLGGSLDHFLKTYYKGTSYQDLLIHGDEFGEIATCIRTLKKEIAYGNVLKVLKELSTGEIENSDNHIDRILELVSDNKKVDVKNAIAKLIGNRIQRWYILADLWNYIPEGNSHE